MFEGFRLTFGVLMLIPAGQVNLISSKSANISVLDRLESKIRPFGSRRCFVASRLCVKILSVLGSFGSMFS